MVYAVMGLMNVFVSFLLQSLSDLHDSVNGTIATESEQTQAESVQAAEEQAAQEPDIPRKPSVPEPVPQSPTDPEPNTEVKVTRRASQATDKAQKRARRLSVPGNLLSFLTGGGRRKSGFWGDNSPAKAGKDSSTMETENSSSVSTGDSESTDKSKQQTSQVDVTSDEAASTRDNEANEETDKETDKDDDKNLNHLHTPAQLPTTFSDKETLDLTKVDTDPDDKNCDEKVTSDDSVHNDQTFWKSLQNPAIHDTLPKATHPQSYLVFALNLETAMTKHDREEEHYKNQYLDLACSLKTCSSPFTTDENNVSVEMPSNNVHEVISDLEGSQQTNEGEPDEGTTTLVEEKPEVEREEREELEKDGGTWNEMKEEACEESNGETNTVTEDEERSTNAEEHKIEVRCEDPTSRENIALDVGNEDENSEKEESSEEAKDLNGILEEHLTTEDNVKMEDNVENDIVDLKNENEENTRQFEKMEATTQNEMTDITVVHKMELSCQPNTEEISAEREINKNEAVKDEISKEIPDHCSKTKEDCVDSIKPENNLQGSDTERVQNIEGEQTKTQSNGSTTDVTDRKTKKQVMFILEEDKMKENKAEESVVNGSNEPHVGANGKAPKESNKDTVPPLSPTTDPPLSPGLEGVSL